MKESLKDARILIVDDQQPNIEVLETMLLMTGYANVKSTTESREAIELIKQYQPNLLLLDLMMPNVSGFDIMKQLKDEGLHSGLMPILVLTADATSETKKRALSEGASDFLTKPFDLSEVGLRIKNLLCNVYLLSQLQNQNEVLETKVAERTAELNIKNKELADFAQHLQTVSETEKKDIARELHDDLGQYLTGMRMALAWVKKHVGDEKSALEKKLDEVDGILTETVASFRRIHSSLHPAMLEDLGLFSTIEWYIKSLEKFTKIEIRLWSNMKEMELDFKITLPLYRIVQETFTNILRYSKATKVSVMLFEKSNTIYLRINEDGIGFDVAGVDTKLHHGILGMKERVYAINGVFDINSTIGTGTSTCLKIPLNK